MLMHVHICMMAWYMIKLCYDKEKKTLFFFIAIKDMYGNRNMIIYGMQKCKMVSCEMKYDVMHGG